MIMTPPLVSLSFTSRLIHESYALGYPSSESFRKWLSNHILGPKVQTAQEIAARMPSEPSRCSMNAALYAVA